MRDMSILNDCGYYIRFVKIYTLPLSFLHPFFLKEIDRKKVKVSYKLLPIECNLCRHIFKSYFVYNCFEFRAKT